MSQPIYFQIIDWSVVDSLTSIGKAGEAKTKALQFDGFRIREVQYGAGYLADHWCQKGHIVHCLEGGFIVELEEGHSFEMLPRMSYVVSDGESSHRSFSKTGVKLLIVDGKFLATTTDK